MSNAQTILGGWTPYRPLTPADQQVFNEAMAGIVDVTYKPQAVSTQQVFMGTNYRFRCMVSVPPTPLVWETIVEIYQTLEGKPYLTSIIRL
jgi:hypothetical protein